MNDLFNLTDRNAILEDVFVQLNQKKRERNKPPGIDQKHSGQSVECHCDEGDSAKKNYLSKLGWTRNEIYQINKVWCTIQEIVGLEEW